MPVDHLQNVIIRYIKAYFEAPGIELLSSTCLAEKFNDSDPDCFSEFLEDFSQHFLIELPIVKNVKKYNSALQEKYGGRYLGFFRRSRKKPVMYIDHITVEQLSQIAAEGRWPTEYVLEADALL